MSKYTWVVTKGNIVGGNSAAVGKIGPSGSKNRLRFDIVIKHGEHFRMLSVDGEVTHSGYIIGEYTGNEPLDEYGRENGCTNIQYFRDGRWMAPSATVPAADA